MSGALGIACHMSSPLERSVWQLCKALLRIVIGSEAVGSLPHSYASKCAGRETKARYYMPYEQPLGEGARRRRRIECLEEAPFYVAVSMTTVQSATSYRHFERSEKSLSFAASRSMIGNSKRETCYPLTFGHRPIYIAAKLPPQP